MDNTLNIEEAKQALFTLKDWLRWTVSQFNAHDLMYGHGTDNSVDEALNLILATLHLPLDADANFLEARLTDSEKALVAERVKKRVETHLPVPYLVKEAWFGGLGFYVDERVIIPRSPIAELIEEQFNPWVEQDNVSRILDMCTGSGCIAILSAVNFPDAEVDAVDISQDALAVAKINVDRFDVEDQVNLIESNLFESVPKQAYDIIISNPPYVNFDDYVELPKEYHHEPKNALIAEDKGFELVIKILREASEYLSPHGILVVEVGYLYPFLEERFPEIPFTWLQFERGGEGVFLLTAEELNEFKPYLK